MRSSDNKRSNAPRLISPVQVPRNSGKDRFRPRGASILTELTFTPLSEVLPQGSHKPVSGFLWQTLARGRVAVLAFALSLALLAAVGANPPATWAQEEFFVLNNANNSITVYARTASGNTAPLRTLSGPATGKNNTQGMAVDLVNNELVVANAGNKSVTVYARTAAGNTPPLRTLAGSATGLCGPDTPTVDTLHNELVVGNGCADGSITVYPRAASGNTPPLRSLSGAATGLLGDIGLFVDTVHDELVVANFNFNSVTVFARTAAGNTPPLRTLSGAATGLVTPSTVVVDTVHDELVVTNFNNDSVTVFARTASGNSAPLRTLAGSSTGLNFPQGLAVDTVHDELVVTNPGNPSVPGIDSITVYSRTANGNTPPLRTLVGGTTGLTEPISLAVTTTSEPPVIPSLSEWGMIVLAGLLALSMFLGIRRRGTP